MNPIVILVILGMVGLVVGLVMLGRYLERKRREAVTAFAEANGYATDPDVNGFQSAMVSFKLFNQGHSRQVKNLIRVASEEVDVAVCDYEYTTGAGKNRQIHHQTICVVRSPKLSLGHFFLRRQVAVFDFLGKVFGGQDINFDDDPEFSKTYVLQTAHLEDDLRRRFGDSVRRTFVELAPKGVQVEGQGDRILFHYGRRLKTDRFRELVDDTLNVRRLF